MKIEIYSKIIFNIFRLPAYLVAGLLLMFTSSLKAQEKATVINDEEEEDTFKIHECMPEFPGGIEAFRKFVADNVEYPADSIDTGGKVLVSFIVGMDGSVSDEKIVSSLSAAFDSAAINVVRKMPRWIPCGSRFKPVRLRITMPVVFKSEADNVQTENDTIIYTTPDQRPEFPGGELELSSFIRKNLKIPIVGTSDMIYKGRTIVEFVVEKDGSISHPVILRSIDSYTDKEALRLIRLMPKWSPAQYDGKTVRAKFIIPFLFQSKNEFESEPSINYIEQMPEFPGGKEVLSDYFKKNLKLPFSVTDLEYEGRVVVQFIVEQDGTVTNPVVIRSVEPQMDEEALRVIRAMPRWKPGMLQGAPVRVKYTLPVSFR